ncbi:MAG: RluA family pseudouridine synthase [Desulfobacterales bacterium]|jgi:23S rRNA pseudouridine1911/1915/1917 synthase|nr:RluA family pseudouridine synthase [Desulfobacteraceae bacterium]MDY0311665.1 RluA family pseudouridine synthase [Desulfobacterales bacterium]
MTESAFRFTVPEAWAGQRLDQFLAICLTGHSRAFLAGLIREGQVMVNGLSTKPSVRLRLADIVSGILPPPRAVELKPEPIDLSILYEDQDLIVINKPSGLVVHPAPGHPGGTLVNALLHRCPDLGPIAGEIRPGIVHRLDKDTSGVLVAAKSAFTLDHLARQFKDRSVEKTYLALVKGHPRADSGKVTLPIGRHPVDRKKMSVHSRRPRSAETAWRVKEGYSGYALLEVRLMTGRTHQIRVHCAAVGHPLLGDRLYGGPNDLLLGGTRIVIPRQMLHAWHLTIRHPVRQTRMSFEAPLPPDMAGLADMLRRLDATA